jgi:photosystem II stability/assembly factor-like uncharacterized protein
MTPYLKFILATVLFAPLMSFAAPAIHQPEKAPVIAAAMAGSRVVAAGDYGIVILSDDGRTFRQAKTVPTRSVLTSVFFLDDKLGWACGHDGTVLATQDGGETWTSLHEEAGKDRVLLSIWFENAQHGIAVGQFGLVLETADGGKTWDDRKLVSGELGDRHMFSIFAGGKGLVLVAAEAGTMFRSDDAGKTWKAVATDNRGSFWSGIALHDGSLIAAGMRGHVYRSTDRGLSWHATPGVTQQSLTVVMQRENGDVVLLGNSGVTLTSHDNGVTFAAEERPDRANITAAVSRGNSARGNASLSDDDLLFTLSGVLAGK